MAMVRQARMKEDYVSMASQGSGQLAAAMLVTPAIVEDPPLEGTINPTDQKVARRLGDSLFRNLRCAGDAKVILVPRRSELGLSIYFTGWSMARNMPRRPHLVIPAGTVIVIEADEKCMNEAARKGVGDHADLGWGSIVYSYPSVG